jgi:hypothetical protein
MECLVVLPRCGGQEVTMERKAHATPTGWRLQQSSATGRAIARRAVASREGWTSIALAQESSCRSPIAVIPIPQSRERDLSQGDGLRLWNSGC